MSEGVHYLTPPFDTKRRSLAPANSVTVQIQRYLPNNSFVYKHDKKVPLTTRTKSGNHAISKQAIFIHSPNAAVGRFLVIFSTSGNRRGERFTKQCHQRSSIPT